MPFASASNLHLLLYARSGRGENIRPKTAERFKAQANEAFKNGDFDGAIGGYTGAIQADPTNPVYFSNRAMAYLQVRLVCCVSISLDIAVIKLLAKTH